jgi:hypothetical protein
MAFDPRSLFGIDCVRCGNELIARGNMETFKNSDQAAP